MDLFVAFDTVSHNVRISRLKDTFDLSGKVLGWFRSYLEHHSQRVSVHGILSDVQFLLSGVPNDSFFVLFFSQCIFILLELMRSDMTLNIICKMTHSYIYHWILTMS